MSIVTVHNPTSQATRPCRDCGHDKPIRAKGLCGACYTRSLSKEGTCTTCGRTRLIRRRGLCCMCYDRALRNGKPEGWTAARRVDTPQDVAAGKAREQEFLDTVLPEVERECRFAFRRFSPDLREERTADATALAWRMFFRRVGDGKEINARVLARQAVGKTKYGTRVGGTESRKEPLSYKCQQQHGLTRSTYEDWIHDVRAAAKDAVVDAAAFNVDYEAWRSKQNAAALAVLDELVAGFDPKEVAARYGMPADLVHAFRQLAAEEWIKVFGDPERR